jgi:SAM-dependent methyltransferase
MSAASTPPVPIHRGGPGDPLPTTLAGFRDIHRGETIVVCGCGPSLTELPEPGRLISIGVNDVGRLFDPTYLVVVNGRNQFAADRFRWVESSRARALFSQLDLRIAHPHQVGIRLGRRGGTDFSDPQVLHYTSNSPYVAVCLAAQMGARRIGLIGVDFVDHHFFAATGTHPLARQLPQIDREYGALAEALGRAGIELVNLSRASRLTALPKVPAAEWIAVPGDGRPRAPAPAPDPLRIVSYATTPIAGVPPVLARCIAHVTPHRARCVWATDRYPNGVVFDGDIQWLQSPTQAEAELGAADAVVVHNGKTDPRHAGLLDRKPVITMAHNYAWNVDMRFTRRDLPGLVVAQYQATLPELAGWIPVPNPVPIWEAAYRPEPKPDQITICYSPSALHERYPPGHRLYWHAKGATTTLAILDRLARELPIRIEAIRGRMLPQAEVLAMKRRAHIVIDECVTGSYHRNSLEGLAAGCVVVNAVGLLPGVSEALQSCAPDSEGSPFVFATLESLESVLRDLIARGPSALAEAGHAGRVWMERHWDFATQWSRWWLPAIDEASERLGRPRVQRRQKVDMGATPVSQLPLRQEVQTSAPGELRVSVVIPHGGHERLPLLAATLASLRQAPALGEVIVVEMGVTPCARDLASCWADRYLFIEHPGPFERARALNAGTAAASHEIVFWQDNDLLHDSGFIGRAAEELQRRQLDFLLPYSVVHYLGEVDSRAVMRGEGSPADCPPMNSLRSSGDGAWWIGCIGVVRQAFVQRHGALIEGFRGWGGEDDAWFHKVRLLGRIAATGRPDQPVYHLYHPLSGGTEPGRPGAVNPDYDRNLALLNEVRSARTGVDLAARFPPRPPTPGQLNVFVPPPHPDGPGLPVWTYWEGPCPDWIRACRRTLSRHAPGLRLLDPETFELLRAGDPDRGIDLSHLHVAHRSDFIRAFLLQRFGGLWIDADCLAMAPLAPALALLAAHDFIGHRARGGVISNAFIGARAGSRIAAAYYSRVRQVVAAKRRFHWNWLGGDLLTEVVSQDGRGWHELPADQVQPICWSRPGEFLTERDAAAHEALVNPGSWTYMLSNVELGKRFPQASRNPDLLGQRTFFTHLLRRSLGGADPRASIAREAGAAAHADELRRYRCESISGTGSSLQQTAAIRQRLPRLLTHLGVQRLLDAPCGDLNWIREVRLGSIEYIGLDILSEFIAAHNARNTDPHRRFVCADMLSDPLPVADAILCRDLLPHLSFLEIAEVLRRFVATGTSYVVMTHFPTFRPNRDTTNGAWRPLSFQLTPFDFPPPLYRLREGCTEDAGVWEDKSLAVWRLDDLAQTAFLKRAPPERHSSQQELPKHH